MIPKVHFRVQMCQVLKFTSHIEYGNRKEERFLQLSKKPPKDLKVICPSLKISSLSVWIPGLHKTSQEAISLWMKGDYSIGFLPIILFYDVKYRRTNISRYSN